MKDTTKSLLQWFLIVLLVMLVAGCTADLTLSVTTSQQQSAVTASDDGISVNEAITAVEAPVQAPESVTSETEDGRETNTQNEKASAPVPESTEPELADGRDIVEEVVAVEEIVTETDEGTMENAEELPMPTILRFSNQTEAAGMSMTHATPITEGDGAKMISGAAAGDFNNDGWTDVYVIGGGLISDALFVNNGDGTFTDMAAEANLAEPHLGSGAAVGDYDKDGWLDIFVTSFGAPGDMGEGRHLLFRNNGDMTFTDVAVEAGVNFTSPDMPDGLGSAFGDYDRDGDLDLFVAGWRKPGGEPALGNRMFRNNGDGTFDDVTEEIGFVDYGVRGFSPCFLDMDGDWNPELLLSADFGTSEYYINNGDGTFTERTYDSGLGKEWSGMGSAVGDINNDGRFDWFVTAIYDDDNVGRGDGNKLYLNQGDHQYEEVANLVGVDDGGWGWGTDIVDMNNDGLPDIVETNGWTMPAYTDEMAKVWVQNTDGTFSEVAEETGFDHTQYGLGLLTFDADNDGDMDVLMTSFNDDLQFYRNDLEGSDTNWLRINLDTTTAPDFPPFGDGSRIHVTVGDQTYHRYQTGCAIYLTQSELTQHVGLGGADLVDEIIVEWPNGSVTTLNDVDVNQIITIKP